MNVGMPKRVRVLFDEFHSESWSISAARAREIQPEDPANASYQAAAQALARREFAVDRNLAGPLNSELLSQTDVLGLLHPCERKWEHTTSRNPPGLSVQEIEDVLAFVHGGGGLLVITEYEHDKYGDNLNDLLRPMGLQIENGKVFDRTSCVHENPEWFMGEPVKDSPLTHLTEHACFYRAGWCTVLADPPTSPGPQLVWRTSKEAHPPGAALIATATYGAGRVVLVNDSNLFGDDRIGNFDHHQLWLNLLYWLAAPRFAEAPEPTSSTTDLLQPAARLRQQQLIGSVNELRLLQKSDGTVTDLAQPAAGQLVGSLIGQLSSMESDFPHQLPYFRAVTEDLQAWVSSGFARPDFSRALAAFHPERERRNGMEHLVLFPMYTPNASSDTRFEAMIMRTPWPDWLAQLEATTYRNPKFVPGHFVSYSDGYASECAVLFPETVCAQQRPSNDFGVIFCDREVARLQRYALRAADIVRMPLYPELECLLKSKSQLLDTVALWDLIHDASHSLGELPFDPFMIRQRAPFWMYGLEELRVDLRSFEEAQKLVATGFPFAANVCLAMVLDRLFRFPIAGTRVRNYDALGGQLLFAYLHQHDVVIWRDNQLAIDWIRLPEGIHGLRQELTTLYKLGADCSKMTFWIEAHDLISKYLRPNVASVWKAETRAITDELDPKKWIGLVHDDEFPLGSFHVNLLKKMREVETKSKA